MLKDIKVLSFTHFLQGPSAVQILGDLGADVIKIEPLAGAWERHWSGRDSYLNGESIFFLLAGRNQRSISINLRDEECKQVVMKLIGQSDVIVENFRPGVMGRLGFGYEEVSKHNPRIIYCSCSGYGSNGPYVHKHGQDLLIQAISGLASLSGHNESPPTPVGTAVVDQHAAVLAALGIIAALYEREKTGLGKKVESNLLSAALDLQIEPLNYYLNGFDLFDRSRTGIATRFHQAPYGVYETADGYICLSMSSLENLSKLFEDESLLTWTEEQRFEERDKLNHLIAEHFKKKTTNEWFHLCDQSEIWYAPLNSYDQVVNDPQVLWNQSFLSFDHPKAGKVQVLAHPIRYNGQVPPLQKMPPQVGEHSEEILSEIGLDSTHIEQLKSRGAIRSMQMETSK